MSKPSDGTIQHFVKLNQQTQGKRGLDFVVAKLKELNSRYCWTPELRDKTKTNWEQVNNHMWRIKAMYFGGDCELAGWPGATPGQRLSDYRQPRI